MDGTSCRSNLERFRHSLHVPLRLDIYYQYEEAVSDPNGDGGDDMGVGQQHVQKRDLLERWCIDYVPSSDPASSSSMLNSAYGGQSSHNMAQSTLGEQFQQQQQQHLPQHSDDILVQLRRVCRRVVVLLRNLHCLTRLMPTYGLQQSLVLGAERGLRNLGGMGGYYPRLDRHQRQQHPLAVPEDLRHHPAAGQIGFALYPSSTDGLRSEAELFGSSNSPFVRQEVGSIPTPFGTLHLTGFYDSSLQVHRAMTLRVGRLRALGLLGSSKEEGIQQLQYQTQEGQQAIGQQHPLPNQERGAIAIPQRSQQNTGDGTEAGVSEAQRHQSLPSNAMRMAAATVTATSVPFGASPIIQNYAKSPQHRPHTLGRELPPRMMLNRANSLPPERGVAPSANQGVRIGSGTQTPASAGSTPRVAGLEGGENKRIMSGLSLALMNEDANGDGNLGDATKKDGYAEVEPADAPQEVEEESSARRRALHHPPPAMYGYGYNNPEFQPSGQHPLRPSPPDGTGGGGSSVIARSRTSSPSPMVLMSGTPTDCFSSTPPFSQGLAMAAAARAGLSGAPDSPGTPGSAASLRRAGLLRIQQQGGGSGRVTRPSPAGGGMAEKSPPFVNPMSLQAPPSPDSGRAQPSSQNTSPGLMRTSELVPAAPPKQLQIPDPGEKSGGGSNLLPPLSSLDILRTSPFKVSGSSMAAGMGSAAAFASSQQQGSVHNHQISVSGNVGFSLLSSLSGTGASPYSTPYDSGAFPNPPIGGHGGDGPAFSSKMGSAHGYASSALAPRGLINADEGGAEEMPFAVETGPSPSLVTSDLGSNIADTQRASQQGGAATASGLMAGSTASSQLLVASFAHRCATAGRLKMFDEDEGPTKSTSENAVPITHGSSVGAITDDNAQPHIATDELTSQLADLRAFGASLIAE